MQTKHVRRTLCSCGDDVKAVATACPVSIRTVSHTIEGHLAERLRSVAYTERVSESAVIEFALRRLLLDEPQTELGRRMRDAGASLRRKVGSAP